MEKNIAVLSGDGIGPEVTDQALKVLSAIEKKFNHSFITRFAPVGAIAIDLTGDPLPQETLDNPLFDFRKAFTALLNLRMLESGCYVGLPNEEWAVKIMVNLLINQCLD